LLVAAVVARMVTVRVVVVVQAGIFPIRRSRLHPEM
jgi:hypothetical protein